MRPVFGVATMVIFLLAMVITMLMTIASMLKVVFGPSEKGLFAAEVPTVSVRTNYKRLKCP